MGLYSSASHTQPYSLSTTEKRLPDPPPSSKAGSSNLSVFKGCRNWAWILGSAVVGVLAVITLVAAASLFFPPVTTLVPAVIGIGTFGFLAIQITIGSTAVALTLLAIAMYKTGNKVIKSSGENS